MQCAVCNQLPAAGVAVPSATAWKPPSLHPPKSVSASLALAIWATPSENLLADGSTIMAFDLDAKRVQALADKGAQATGGLAAMAQCDLVLPRCRTIRRCIRLRWGRAA